MPKVIDVALAEVGYLEKETNAQLDSDTGNAGDENYTKYARDLHKITGFYNGNKNGFAWCDVFVDWCFVTAYGVELAKKLLNHGQLGAGVKYSAQYYKDAGRWHTSPQVGDQIFFKSGSSQWAHTGLVVEVTINKVITVEGNTSGASGVISNGGGVCKKSYALNFANIVGYGRPDYNLASERTEANMAMPKVYLSPAYHWFNNCSIDGCDETTHNNLYLDELEPFLTACGIAWKRGTRRVPKSDESAEELMYKAIEESNAWGADVHYISHTNASVDDVDDIGKGKAQGYRPIIFKGSIGGKKLAECMIAERKKIYDKPITLNERTDLKELRLTKAVGYYEEHVFHDNLEDATWFHNNLKNIARAACKGMCKYFGIPFVEPKAEKVESDMLYRVQVGAFSVKANADAYLKKVQAAGFPDAYIKAEKR